jgi:hypothetical protein
MRVMFSNGNIVRTSPTENVELFRHALGGYGLFGVILDVDLDIVDNEMYARKAVYMDYKDFPGYYKANVENNPEIGLVFGRLSVAPQSFLRETAVHTYMKKQFDGCLPPLSPARHNTLDRLIINFSDRKARPVDEVDAPEVCRAASARMSDTQPGDEREGSVPGLAQRRNV